MKLHTSLTLFALICITATPVLADCAADATVQETQQSFARGQKLERSGDVAGAFYAYVGAQAYTCDPNPVEAQAAQRAAALALQLGNAAEQKRDFEKAFDIYDQGGQYAPADRALMNWVRANPDSPAAFQKAREALDYRALPAFAANNKVRLGVTGAYQPDAKNLAEVLAMPARGFERALQKETEAFNEDYLRGIVQRNQTRPNDPSDIAALQSWMSAQQPFVQKWSKYPDGNPLKASLQILELARTWSASTYDNALGAKLVAQRNQRLEQRVATLTKSYSGAPELLEAAIDYQMDVLAADDSGKKARVAAIKAQAAQLGDAANARQLYALAADYYDVADQDAKAQAVRDTQQKLAMSRMQPQIDQMKQQAERLKQQYSDPARVQAMREQALAMQKSLQQQQQANAKSNAKKADDLEKELGL